MLSPQKQVATHRFFSVNTSDAREYLSANEAVFMLNCVTLSTAKGDVGVVTNLKGNTLISTNLHEGRNRTLGWASDEENNKFYYFVWNENGYHTIYRYDGLLNRIDAVMQSITDTGGVDIFRWKEEDLIRMADVVRNTQLYWVKRGNDAAKINIEKAMDKSDNGYGFISEEFVNAYKLAPAVAPINVYASDTTVDVNYLYGFLFRTIARYRYDDGEESNWSDWSSVATPAFESFTGANYIPEENNRLDIKVPTGSKIVTDIEIAMQYTIEGGLSPWVLITRLNKKKLSIGDNSEYTYPFYNENRGSYPVLTSQEKVVRPYSFLPDQPLVQAFTDNVMIYGNFKEGFPDVPLDVSVSSVDYTPLFLDDAVEDTINDAEILIQHLDEDYITYPQSVTFLDGTVGYSPEGVLRANKFKLTIKADVKKGNIFYARFYNGYDDYNFSVEAQLTDTATTIANKFKQLLIGTGKLLRDTPDMTPVDIYDNDNVGGDVSFEFILYGSNKKSYYNTTYNAVDVETSTLKDTGQSVGNMKLGESRKFGIVYGDFKGKVSLTYTDNVWIVPTDSANDLDGIQKVNIVLNINHKPPVWAKTFEIVRTAVDTNFIQLLIQKVIDVEEASGGQGEYLDLLVGSLYAFQKIHPNTTLKYQFKKGDRLRLLQKEDESYYPFFETEILSYSDTVNTDITESVKISGVTEIEVVYASLDNVGKFIIINGVEREIVGVDDATHYTVNSPIGDSGTPETFFSYTLVDRRGSIRIRKPSEEVLPDGIEDLSTIEIFSPEVQVGDGEPFYHFNKKFNIIDAGLETRQHFGDIQSQTNSQPAKISVSEAEIYVRQREMPVTNNKPAQLVIRIVEDPAYSDYYFSRINSNGRANSEDRGIGVVDFGDRLRFSNNYIEDTQINGLNDFDNLDRKDYNDKYGNINLIVYTEKQLLTFKQLKVGIIPIYQTIIQDNAGQEVLGTSSKLLNDIRYYSHMGGINNNPEAYTRNESQHYYADVNLGHIVRLGGDGATPISEVYKLDNYVSEVLAEAYKNGAQVFLEWDANHNMLIVSVSDYENFTFNSTFSEANWKVLDALPPNGSPIELLTAPDHATATLDGEDIIIQLNPTYTGEDELSYRVFTDGAWKTRSICLDIEDLSNRQKAWRPRTSDAECEQEGGENTGRQIFITLEEYWTDTNELTGEIKPNTVGDPDYVFPIENQTACPFTGTVYENVEKNGTATKNNCPAGQTGSTETYTVPAGEYTSIVSQAAADAKAQNDVDLNKQAYANSVGTCTPTASFGNDAKTQYFTKNDCGGGLFGSSVPYTVNANTYYASTKAAANALRDANINANGQTNANTLGTCSSGGSFTFEVVIYPDYKGGVFLTTDSRGISFQFYNVALSSTFYQFLVSTNVLKDSIVHTYNIPIPGSSIYLSNIRFYQQFNATSVGGGATDRSYVNGVIFGNSVNSITGGQPSGTQYTQYVGVQTTINNGDVVRVTMGDSPTTYYSAAASFPATKNNCPAGAIGSTVNLNLPYGLYTSTVSQADADAQATTYGNANKQAYANTNGSCAYGNDLRSAVFKTQDCPDGFTGGNVTYTVPANTYYAPTKAEANSDADADIADNGQDYANTAPNRNCVPIVFPDFTFLGPWRFTDIGALNLNNVRTYNQDTLPTAPLWAVRNSGYGLRISWENSLNCGGANNKVQEGTAAVNINVPTAQTIQIIWTGIAELQDSGYENMSLYIDNVLIGKATSAGGLKSCQMGNVISTNYYPSGYPLTVGEHTISITATTSDALYHVDSYYDFVLTKIS